MADQYLLSSGQLLKMHGSIHMKGVGPSRTDLLGWRSLNAGSSLSTSSCDLGRSRRALLQFQGSGVELVVLAMFGYQLIVVAALDDSPMVQDHDHI